MNISAAGLMTVMTTTGVDGEESVKLQVDNRNRLYINGQRIATEIDLGEARLPIWITASAAVVAALATVAQAIAMWMPLWK